MRKEVRWEMKRKESSFCKPFLSKRFVEVAIVLYLLFFVALPTIAAEDDFVLGVYGNANEDDTIDMRDLTYVKLIFFGEKPETELADAKYDSKINPLDFIQIKLIIVGTEKELTLVDSADRIVTVRVPVERIAVLSPEHLEVMRSLKVEKDRIVGVGKSAVGNEIFFPEFSDYPNLGSGGRPDIEQLLTVKPDVVFLYAVYWCDKTLDKIRSADPNIRVIRLECYRPGDIHVEEVKKMGYVLGKVEEAENYLDLYEGYMDTIKDNVEKIPEEDRQKVYFEWKLYHTGTKKVGYGQKVEMAGGNNIFSEEPGKYIEVDPEAVIKRDPEIIVRLALGKVAGYSVDTDDIAELKKVRQEIMHRPELEHVTAVGNGNVYVITNEIFGGVRHFVGIGYMAKWFYPEIFKDLDPKAIHQEYLTEFQGLDYDLDEHGVFVYPEPS